jgi:hypothetical protein
MLATMSELALILVYLCALVIKACDLAADACGTYGFGDDSKGVFLFFLFFGLSVLLLQLIFEVAALIYSARQQRRLRRLRHRGGGFVELPPLTKNDFAHLPGLEPSPCFHLFLSHAWPLGQDVCKLIRQRYREICPSMHVFLDVDDLTSGSGTKEVDHSLCILIFAMAVYFEKINCVKELTRAIVRHKQITLLLPDSEVHGVFTTSMIAEIVTNEWIKRWKLEKKLAEWAEDWGVAEVKVPTAEQICDTLFKQPPLEWSRITPFQDRTMVLACRRLLPEAKRNIYLQGSASFALPNKHNPVKVYCSRHNPGSAKMALEMNLEWRGLLEIVDSLGECEHMLVYLNAQTWTHEPEAFAAEIRDAMLQGIHLQSCHEFPSVIDADSARQALAFKEVMDATPADLTKWPRNIYSQIAIALKGGELRDVGLANLAAKLVQRVPRAVAADEQASNSHAVFLASKLLTFRQLRKWITKNATPQQVTQSTNPTGISMTTVEFSK